jgi:NADPH-dependent 2,4-dienoyl-CoA reductase/sulfur reductase-like enzyme
MKRFDYLIAGGGMAAASAIKGIRQLDREGSIGLVGAEIDPPYDRPPLSKSLWKGKPLEAIWMESDGAELILGRALVELKSSNHTLRCDDGTWLEYGQLLIATGGRPRRLPFPASQVLYLHDLADYRALRASCAWARRFLVVGGGFIASEIAAALAELGKEVTMAFPEAGLASRILPNELSLFLNERFRAKGVELLCGDSLVSLESRAALQVAGCRSGRELAADVVVAGLGIEPNAELAVEAGLLVEDGIAVGPDLRTSEGEVFAAGDVASYRCEALGGRIRCEHEDNALAMGLAAGRNMAGAAEEYGRIPYFYSDLFDLGYEAVGEPDPEAETVVDWRRPFEEGTIYYLRGGRVRGVVLWNLRKRVSAARDLVASPLPLSARELSGRL